jgi:X-Pro dipeptidyl-peptidase (S15 family)
MSRDVDQHVPLRGGGSTGEWGFFDEQERPDLYALAEWTAEQPWSDGNNRPALTSRHCRPQHHPRHVAADAAVLPPVPGPDPQDLPVS